MVVGAALWAVAARSSGLNPAEPLALGAALMGSLLPDIDHPNSWAGRKIRPISTILGAVIGHRGITHSLVAVVGALVLLALMGQDARAAPIIVGYLSHLAADALTPSGVPLLWPSKKRFSFRLFETGSFAEMALVAAIGLLGGWAIGVDFSHLPKPGF